MPRFFVNEQERGWRAVGDADDDYPDLVYRNRALITQLDGDPAAWDKVRHEDVYLGGHPTSSASSPELVALMLDALDVELGMTVLEIGTGTGYNAALLCDQLGDSEVTTVDVDEHLIEQARRRLAQLDYHPRCVVADATHDVPSGLFDRLISTVGMRHVPSFWPRIVRPGGRILVHLYSDLTSDAVFALTVHGDGTASGGAPIGGTFMPTRENTMPYTIPADDPDAAVRASTRLPGKALDEFGSFYLFASLLLRDVQLRYFTTDEGEFRTGVVSRDGAWAYETNGTVVHGGRRDLWSELERIHGMWEAFGRPGRERLGLTVTQNGQTLWVDAPEAVISSR